MPKRIFHRFDVLNTANGTIRTGLLLGQVGWVVGMDFKRIRYHLLEYPNTHPTVPASKQRKFLKFSHFLIKLASTEDTWPGSDSDSRVYQYVPGLHDRPIQIKNLETGEVFCFGSVRKASESLGIAEKTINQGLNQPGRPFKQYLFRGTSNESWPDIVKSQVPDKSVKHQRGYYLSVTSESGTALFDSIKDVVRTHAISYPTLHRHIKGRGSYTTDRLTISIVDRVR